MADYNDTPIKRGQEGTAVPSLTDAELRATPLPTTISGGVSVSNFPVTQPVSIAATVAVSGPLTDTQLRAAAVPVSGSFYPPTQPVSIAATVAVSGPLTDTQLRATAVPVSGTFYQATQPVSIAAMPSTPVTGTFWQTTQPVSITALPALVAGSALIGKVGIDQTTPGTTNKVSIGTDGTVALAAGQTLATVTTLTSITNAVSTTAPTLTKGTQGANGWTVQDLKDSGRTALAMTAEFTFAQVAETLLTMTLSAAGAATTTFTSRVITSGKRMRIQSAVIQVELLGSGTAPQRAYLRMRVNTGGATTATSARQWVLPVGATTAIVKGSNWASLEIPDGFEIAGDGTATFGFTLETPDWVTTTATGRAYITVFGYEY